MRTGETVNPLVSGIFDYTYDSLDSRFSHQDPFVQVTQVPGKQTVTGLRAGISAWLIIATVPLLQSCNSAQPLSPPHVQAMPVKLLTLQSQPVEEASTFVGQLKSRKSVQLNPQVAGQVLAIYVRNGDQVLKGAKLMDLDRSKQQATVNSCQAAIQSSEAERKNGLATLQSLEANRLSKMSALKYARQQHHRYRLLQSQGAVSQENVDQWENQSKIGDGDLQAVDAQIQAQKAMIAKDEQMIKQATATYKEQQEQLKYFTIFAPFDGIVGDIPIKVGEYVTTSTLLTTVDQPKPLELYLSVPTSQASRLSKGLMVKLLNSQGGEVGSSKIFFISPEVDNSNQTVLVKGDVPNDKRELRSGQEISVKLVWSRQSGVTVPSAAVSRLSGQDFVFVAMPNERHELVAKQKPVKLGEIVGNSFVVQSGLKAGDAVIVSGSQNLVDGAPISQAPES